MGSGLDPSGMGMNVGRAKENALRVLILAQLSLDASFFSSSDANYLTRKKNIIGHAFYIWFLRK